MRLFTSNLKTKYSGGSGAKGEAACSYLGLVPGEVVPLQRRLSSHGRCTMRLETVGIVPIPACRRAK
jgi:hypothetical protein